MLETSGHHVQMRRQGLVREHDAALTINQSDSVHHRVEGAPPALAHAPNAVGQIVDCDENAPGLGVRAGGNAELHLGKLAIGKPPGGFENGFRSS